MSENESLRDELLAGVDLIAPILAEHAPESEKLGRLDAPSIEAVRSTRLLGLFAPRELGGLEADPVTVALVLEALARIDGSASWTIGILGSGAYLGLTSPLRLRGESSLRVLRRRPALCYSKVRPNPSLAAIELGDDGLLRAGPRPRRGHGRRGDRAVGKK